MLKYKDGDVHYQNYHRILNQKMHCNEINQNARTTMHQLKTVTDTDCAWHSTKIVAQKPGLAKCFIQCRL